MYQARRPSIGGRFAVSLIPPTRRGGGLLGLLFTRKTTPAYKTFCAAVTLAIGGIRPIFFKKRVYTTIRSMKQREKYKWTWDVYSPADLNIS